MSIYITYYFGTNFENHQTLNIELFSSVSRKRPCIHEFMQILPKYLGGRCEQPNVNNQLNVVR